MIDRLDIIPTKYLKDNDKSRLFKIYESREFNIH